MVLKKHEKRKIIVATILLIAAVVIYAAAQNIQGFADWFNQYIYAKVSFIFAWISNWLPFSVVEFLVYGIILWGISSLIMSIAVKLKKRNTSKTIGSKLSTIYLLLSIIAFLYVMNCGVNYYRTSFIEAEHLEGKKYDKEELVQVCQYLSDQINALEKKIPKSKDGVLVTDSSMVSEAPQIMKALSKKYKSLTGYYPRPKGLVVSEILSYQQLSGVYSPFTVEANYNDDMPDYYKAFTVLHELAHLRGFMQEEEANFISILACANSSDVRFQYSGYLVAYSYCMSELRGYDLESYGKIRNQLCKTANLEIEKRNAFWGKYEGKIAEVSDKVNDTYLKANAQVKGVQSYNEVVGLIVANLREQ
ncbi:hypothetical protein lbkm_2071 [Lachnospiraceae bacterium KM106-2]|nr:hypothetical protein lbkm_2071 [Lachnospiraceae bacterium KM106-2]